jgi:hypothetical protein
VHKPHLAFAPERTRIIETLSVLAEIGVVETLVDIHTVVPVPFEPGVTLAFERTVGVDALGVLVAPAVVGQTFVDVSATDAVSGESVLASALVRTLKSANKSRKKFASCNTGLFMQSALMWQLNDPKKHSSSSLQEGPPSGLTE